MKKHLFLSLLVVLMVFASCSSSRYGRVPKSKKQTHEVVKKQFRKKKVELSEGIAAKKPVTLAVETPTVTLNKVEAKYPTYTKQTSKKATQKTEAIQEVQETLKPNKSNTIERQTETQEVSKGSGLWYVLVGILFLILAAIIPWTLGWIFYIVGVIAVIYGLLMILGII